VYREANKKVIAEQRKRFREANKDRIKEQKKKDYENNKRVIVERGKEYYEKNKEQIKAKWAKKITCDRCGGVSSFGHINRHQRTKTCMEIFTKN